MKWLDFPLFGITDDGWTWVGPECDNIVYCVPGGPKEGSWFAQPRRFVGPLDLAKLHRAAVWQLGTVGHQTSSKHVSSLSRVEDGRLFKHRAVFFEFNWPMFLHHQDDALQTPSS